VLKIKAIKSMKNSILFLILVLIYLVFINSKKSQLENINENCPLILDILTQRESVTTVDIVPVGCYINILDYYFLSCVNPFSNDNSLPDNGLTINKYPEDVISALRQASRNGYTELSNSILEKYIDYSRVTITDFGLLGYLCGYKFMSITNNENRNTVFFSYSAPLKNQKTPSKPDLPFTLLPATNKATNEVDNIQGRELSCGNVCVPEKSSDGKSYTCGSILYPTIRTPPRYSVYKLVKKN